MSKNKKLAIITISSDSSDASYPMPWSKYFPKQDEDSSSDSGYDELQIYQQKNGTILKKVDASMNPTPNQIANQAFADRIQVLGMENKETCELLSIKSFAPKNPTDASASQKGKGKKMV